MRHESPQQSPQPNREDISASRDNNAEISPLEEDLATRAIELQASAPYQAFLSDLCRIADLDTSAAERTATSVLCILDQSLRAGKAREPYATMPLRLQELMAGCERPGELPPLVFTPDEFVSSVAADLDKKDEEAERLIKAVCTAARKQLSVEEARTVAKKMPRDVQRLWFGSPH
jgi:uncharacterized protein (DUF2267 family)